MVLLTASLNYAESSAGPRTAYPPGQSEQQQEPRRATRQSITDER
jgi:hypothetical protein